MAGFSYAHYNTGGLSQAAGLRIAARQLPLHTVEVLLIITYMQGYVTLVDIYANINT